MALQSFTLNLLPLDPLFLQLEKVLPFQSLLLPRTLASTHRHLSTVLQSLIDSHEPGSIPPESVAINGICPSQS